MCFEIEQRRRHKSNFAKWSKFEDDTQGGDSERPAKGRRRGRAHGQHGDPTEFNRLVLGFLSEQSKQKSP